ncbi:tetratricopeptide repeat protein [Neobacillus sp. NPDC097160]|uniref:tetratricopeptide repeat protein n=1 Tax=Neobacillus sp. NPDC097160 TaxID=3364298 RepID=UPI00380CFAA7
MDKEMIMPTELSIKDKKKVEKGNVMRVAIFARSKVIEVLTQDDERFYLIYYKHSFIYGAKLDQVEEGAFINKAFQEGIVIESPHPLLTVLIPEVSVSIPNRNKLFSQLQLHFSLQEVAHIATTLDSFFEKDQLIAMIDKIYFHLRRSGKFMKSFQVLQLLCDFSPSLKSAKERLDSHEFTSYRNFYHPLDYPSIMQKDPLFVELHCFKNRSLSNERMVLENILCKQDGLTALLLWLENANRLQNAQSVAKYTEIALGFITMEEWMLALGQVNINPFRVLPESKLMLEKMLRKGNYHQAASCLFKFIHDLPSSYNAILETIWENCDATFVLKHLDEFAPLLEHLSHPENTKQLEDKIFKLAVNMLNEHDLPSVHTKLLAIERLYPQSEVIRKINKMVELVEDPDRMMDLGDYYAEFKQYDKAIDCFFWEMELQPQNPSPVRKISKMYQNKGLPKEAAAYQKIYNQIENNQETG